MLVGGIWEQHDIYWQYKFLAPPGLYENPWGLTEQFTKTARYSRTVSFGWWWRWTRCNFVWELKAHTQNILIHRRHISRPTDTLADIHRTHTQRTCHTTHTHDRQDKTHTTHTHTHTHTQDTAQAELHNEITHCLHTSLKILGATGQGDLHIWLLWDAGGYLMLSSIYWLRHFSQWSRRRPTVQHTTP